MGFIRPERKQGMLLGNTLEEFVGPQAKCRFVVELVGQLDLSSLYAQYSEQGADAYDPGMMLATWFLAYSEGITSTRELERRCQRDLHYIYISGNLRPDHTSLSRFRQRHVERLSDCFLQILLRARERGVSEFRRISVDGSKFRANASGKRSRDQGGLSRELEEVRQEIGEYLKRCQMSDEESGGQDLEAVRGEIARLREVEKTLLERQKQLEDRQKELKPEHRGKHKINLTDPDARNQKGKGPGYNGQVSVDMDSQLIVAAEVVSAANDQEQFARQHDQVETNLGPSSQREYTTDSGFNSLEQLRYAQREGIDVVMADPFPEQRSAGPEHARAVQERSLGQFPRGAFVYEAGADRYVCPAGGRMDFWREHRSGGRAKRLYRGKDCSGCPLRDRCLGKRGSSDARTISRDVEEGLSEAMFARSRTPQGRERLKKRASSVEPVFGNIKSNLGIRGFRLRGLKKVQGEFLLICIGHNLNKLYRLFGWVSVSASVAGAISEVRSRLAPWTRHLRMLRRPSATVRFPLSARAA